MIRIFVRNGDGIQHSFIYVTWEEFNSYWDLFFHCFNSDDMPRHERGSNHRSLVYVLLYIPLAYGVDRIVGVDGDWRYNGLVTSGDSRIESGAWRPSSHSEFEKWLSETWRPLWVVWDTATWRTTSRSMKVVIIRGMVFYLTSCIAHRLYCLRRMAGSAARTAIAVWRESGPHMFIQFIAAVISFVAIVFQSRCS